MDEKLVQGLQDADLGRLDKSPTFAGAASSESRSLLYIGEDRRRRLLLRAIACEESAGKALNEGIKEIYLDLAAQWRDLARLSMGAPKYK